MRQSGVTTDDTAVWSGIAELTNTHGMPLDMVLFALKEKGRVPDWIDYIQTCLSDGHNPRTIKSRILAAVETVYGREHANRVAERLQVVLNG